MGFSPEIVCGLHFLFLCPFIFLLCWSHCLPPSSQLMVQSYRPWISPHKLWLSWTPISLTNQLVFSANCSHIIVPYASTLSRSTASPQSTIERMKHALERIRAAKESVLQIISIKTFFFWSWFWVASRLSFHCYVWWSFRHTFKIVRSTLVQAFLILFIDFEVTTNQVNRKKYKNQLNWNHCYSGFFCFACIRPSLAFMRYTELRVYLYHGDIIINWKHTKRNWK